MAEARATRLWWASSSEPNRRVPGSSRPEPPGWREDIRERASWQGLPPAARDYVQYIAEFTKTRVKFIAVGPGRDETTILPRSIGRGGAV